MILEPLSRLMIISSLSATLMNCFGLCLAAMTFCCSEPLKICAMFPTPQMGTNCPGWDPGGGEGKWRLYYSYTCVYMLTLLSTAPPTPSHPLPPSQLSGTG